MYAVGAVNNQVKAARVIQKAVIQKNVRGYLARKNLKEQQEAATTIQKHFKAYKARKTYNFIKNVLNKSPHDTAKKLIEALTGGKNALEKAFEKVVFCDKESILEFMKYLPVGAKITIGKQPWKNNAPELNLKKLRSIVRYLQERNRQGLKQEAYSITLNYDKRVNIDYIGEGTYGRAYNINTGDDKNYVLKIFKDKSLKEHYSQGKGVESNIACFIKTRKARKGFAKFYFADFGKSLDNSYMITKYIDKAKPVKSSINDANPKFVKIDGKQILCIDGLLCLDWKGNIIGKRGKRKIIDYGGIRPRGMQCVSFTDDMWVYEST